MRELLTIIAFCTVLTSAAQNERPWEVLFSQFNTIDDIETQELEDTYEMLCDLEQQPLNINTADRDDLLKLPFLNEKQVEDIHAYIYQYGAMKTVGELAMIESIDFTTRCLLSYFIYFGEIPHKEGFSMEKALRYGKHDLLLTGNIPFYERRGDKEIYLGYQYSHSVRYKFQYSDRLKFGLIGSQDAGEPFFADKNSLGYDYYSFYVEAGKLGRLKKLVAGRFRASFGMGLIMNNDLRMGKLTSLSSLGNNTSGFRAHSSRTPNYLQGAGATVELYKGLDISAFISYRKIDATLTKDSLSMTTILTTDYHRTPTEMAKKNNTSETSSGAHIGYSHAGFHGGISAIAVSTSRELRPDTSQAYRKYYPSGDRFWNASVDYGYTGPLVSVSGETAIGDCGAIATVNTLSITPSSAFSLMALYRFYGKKYYSLHSNSFSEGGRVQNESGLYLGARWQPVRPLQLTAYTDYAYFPASKYQALASSRAWDNLLQAQYNNDRLSLTLRYRLKMREYDNSEMTALAWKTIQRVTAGASIIQGPWQWGLRGDVSHSDFKEQSFGWMVSGHCSFTHHWLKLNAAMGYFNTDDTESRIYGYETGTLYSYGYRQYDGEGIQYALTARMSLNSRLLLIAHLSAVDYFDRDHISTGWQRIDHSSKTDLALQLKWRF